MSGEFRNLFDWDGLMDDPKRRGMLGMGMSLLGDSGYSRVPVTLGQALGRGFLQGLDQYGQGREAHLAADARRAAEAEAEAKQAQAQFEQDLALKRFGLKRDKFKHEQAESKRQDRLLMRFFGPKVASGPVVSPESSGPAPAIMPTRESGPAQMIPADGMPVPPVSATGSPVAEPVGQPAGAGDFSLTPQQAMAMKAVGLPDFTDDVSAHRRHQFDEKKLAYQQKKDVQDFHYKTHEKRIDQLRGDWAALSEMPARYQRLLDAEQLIDEGIYSGSWPERTFHSLNKFIPMDRQGLARTEAFFALMGREVLEIIKGLGAGTGLSDADREYAGNVAGGNIELSEAGLRKIIGVGKKAIKSSVETWNTGLPNRQKGVADYFPENLNVTLPGLGGSGPAEPAKPPSEMTDDELRRDLGL